jgi:hypothetical protein
MSRQAIILRPARLGQIRNFLRGDCILLPIKQRISHELRELREKENNFSGDSKKRPGRENGKEGECRFFAVFAQFVVSLSFTRPAVAVFA